MSEKISIEEYIRNLFVMGKVTAHPPSTDAGSWLFTARIDHVDEDTLSVLHKFLYSRGYKNPLIDVRPSGGKVAVRVMLR